MWIDPIVEEVRQIKISYAAEFNNDLDAIYRDLKAQELASGRTYVSYERQPVIDTPVPKAPPVSEPHNNTAPHSGAVPAA